MALKSTSPFGDVLLCPHHLVMALKSISSFDEMVANLAKGVN